MLVTALKCLALVLACALVGVLIVQLIIWAVPNQDTRDILAGMLGFMFGAIMVLGCAAVIFNDRL